MTAFVPANLPVTVDTVEKLAVWAGNVLVAINPAVTAVEGTGYSERVAQSNPYYVQADNKVRLVLRQSIPLSLDYLAGGNKLWAYAQPLSATAIPGLYLP